MSKLDELVKNTSARLTGEAYKFNRTDAYEPETVYDFSDLVGKLQWDGDAVKEQRRLRDER